MSQTWILSANTITGCGAVHPPLTNFFVLPLGILLIGLSSITILRTVGLSMSARQGPFTGICAYQDSVLFFKEDYIHRVYGTRPQNFQVITTNCQGVEKGSARSVCILDEQIFYKRPTWHLCLYWKPANRHFQRVWGCAV